MMHHHPRPSRPIARAILLAALIAAFSSPATALAEPGGDDKVFVGYLYGRPRDVNFGLYTHICHAFLVADEQGRVRPSRGVPDADLAAEAHKAGAKILLSLGGWGWDKQFAALTSDPEAEDRYVKSVLEAVAQADYDGIDLDWEYPDTEAEVVGFERLTRRLRKGLDEAGKAKGRPMLVTMAAAANPGTLKWLEKDFLLETMDWVNVMTYDFTGDWTPYAGHHSPLHASSKQPAGPPRSAELTMKFLLEERGIPANRLALGIPLYGRGFAVAEPYASTKGAPKVRLPGGNYANIHKLLAEGKWTRQWDEETKNPWLISPDGTAVIGYDDAESVAAKADWAMGQGLRGVFFWQVAGDRLPDGTNPLQEAARKAVDSAPRPAK